MIRILIGNIRKFQTQFAKTLVYIFVHQVFAPTEKEIIQAEKIVRAYREQSAAGVGVFTVDGKMIDIAFIPGAERTLRLARACGLYEGDLV